MFYLLSGDVLVRQYSIHARPDHLSAAHQRTSVKRLCARVTTSLSPTSWFRQREFYLSQRSIHAMHGGRLLQSKPLPKTNTLSVASSSVMLYPSRPRLPHIHLRSRSWVGVCLPARRWAPQCRCPLRPISSRGVSPGALSGAGLRYDDPMRCEPHAPGGYPGPGCVKRRSIYCINDFDHDAVTQDIFRCFIRSPWDVQLNSMAI